MEHHAFSPRLIESERGVVGALGLGAFVLSVFVLLAGCPGTDGTAGGVQCVDCDASSGESCERAEDCNVGERCKDGSCVPAEGCTENDDCPDGLVCKGGNCYAEESDIGFGYDSGEPTDVGDTGPDTRDVPDYGDVKNCRGCIAGDDTGRVCVAGTEKGACGKDGEPCKICNDDQTCEDGSCVTKTCTPANCAGCCKDGECETGDTAQACGTNGEQCDVCSGSAKCVDGSCKIVCGPESCAGCCNSEGKCLDGNTDSSCGSDGASCSSCDTDEKCSNGTCVLESCSNRCTEGCCDGSTCKDGTSDQACGDGGESCTTCDAGHTCEFQRCDVIDNSRWDVIGISGEVPESDENGVFYDSRFNKPDVFLKVENEGFTSTTSGRTSVDEGDLTPFWNEETIVDARAKDLKRYNKTTLTLIDEDPWYDPSGNDEIASCVLDLDDRHFNGSSYRFTCNDGVETKMTIRLRHHP